MRLGIRPSHPHYQRFPRGRGILEGADERVLVSFIRRPLSVRGAMVAVDVHASRLFVGEYQPIRAARFHVSDSLGFMPALADPSAAGSVRPLPSAERAGGYCERRPSGEGGERPIGGDRRHAGRRAAHPRERAVQTENGEHNHRNVESGGVSVPSHGVGNRGSPDCAEEVNERESGEHDGEPRPPPKAEQRDD